MNGVINMGSSTEQRFAGSGIFSTAAMRAAKLSSHYQYEAGRHAAACRGSERQLYVHAKALTASGCSAPLPSEHGNDVTAMLEASP